MSRKNKNVQPMVIIGSERWQAQKPRYNAHQTGTGAHGDRKYSRKQKHKGGHEEC